MQAAPPTIPRTHPRGAQAFSPVPGGASGVGVPAGELSWGPENLRAGEAEEGKRWAGGPSGRSSSSPAGWEPPALLRSFLAWPGHSLRVAFG